MRRVVVTGIGIVAPIGVGLAQYWPSLLAGECGVRKLSTLDASGFPCHIGAEAPEYKIGDYVPKSYRKATKLMARDIELAVVAAGDAFKDAGIQSRAYTETPSIDSFRFGCNIGAGLISADLNELTAAMHSARRAEPIKLAPGSLQQSSTLDLAKWGGEEGMGKLTPLWLLKYLPNMLACHVTIIHGLMGPSNTITCADASSHLAIGEAFRTIQRGKADLAICGGAESRINPMGIIRYQLLNRLNTTSNDNPSAAVRPFDQTAAGTVCGEGGGLLILEEFEHAKKRGAKIYAEIVGFAASQDTYSITEPDPTGHSYSKALENAMKDAKVNRDDVSLIMPHGLGIARTDAAEYNGLSKAFGSSLGKPAASFIKAQLGSFAAGGGVDAATAVLSIANNMVPPSINSHNLIGDVKLNVSPQARRQNVNIAISSTYSLGGQNAALVFKKI